MCNRHAKLRARPKINVLTGNSYFGTIGNMKKRQARPAEVSETNKWEMILKKAGLGMDAGRDPGHRKTVLVGNSTDLEGIYEMLVGENGKVRPEGAGPDDFQER